MQGQAQGPSFPPLAIVATNTFSIASTGAIVAGNYLAPGDDAGSVPQPNGGGGAGHVTRGGGSGSGGPYGPTEGPRLISGSWGADGVNNGIYYEIPVPGGPGGGALQVVACHDLTLLGAISVSGSPGTTGASASGTHFTRGADGSGGGSGGTLVIEAVRVVGSGSLSAKGGNGGPGADYEDSYFSLFCAGGAGGSGGTGSSPPGDGTAGQFCSTQDVYGSGGSGGGGGSVGRIVVDLPDGSAPPSFVSDPPPSFGVVTVH
jgi:hypothetical protein